MKVIFVERERERERNYKSSHCPCPPFISFSMLVPSSVGLKEIERTTERQRQKQANIE